jgi:carbamate kinase
MTVTSRTAGLRVVAALGGNALLRRGEPMDSEVQRRNVARAAEALAPIARDHTLVVTHGNGPQVGLLALQAAAYQGVAPYPLDVLGAESEGMIGYLVERELRARLPDRQVVTLLTQVEVDRSDPAFARPTKPIGPVFDRERGERLARERGWTMTAENGGLRRVVPSPEPLRIVELPAIALLVEAGAIVVCAGGGGIPIVVDESGSSRGVEAVIDKDLAAALLARELASDVLLLLTDVDAVYLDWGRSQRPLTRATPVELRRHRFAEGSMGPKVEAACRFVEATRRRAAIGRLEDAAAVLAGSAGTQVLAA